MIKLLSFIRSIIFFLALFSASQINGIEMENDTPPEMPEYPSSYEEIMASLSPYYKAEQPLDFFFELYIVYTLNELPQGTLDALESFSNKHSSFFESTNGNWKQSVVSQLNLSKTIDIAIWDLWIRNSKTATENGWIYHPWHFAKNFLENYFSEDSEVDIWTPETLENAKERIRMFQENGN